MMNEKPNSWAWNKPISSMPPACTTITITCAKDMAIGRALIQEGRRYPALTSTYDDYIRADTENKFWLVNTNKLIRTISGMTSKTATISRCTVSR
ncbi:MAG: hypothetical protein ACLSA6_04740 [Holdemania massiliensis]